MPESNYPTSSDFKSDASRAGEHLDALKADVAGLAHDAAHAVHSGAAQIQNAGSDALELAKQKLAEGKHAAEDAAESVKKLISDNPLASVGIATGLGILIGLVLVRPRS